MRPLPKFRRARKELGQAEGNWVIIWFPILLGFSKCVWARDGWKAVGSCDRGKKQKQKQKQTDFSADYLDFRDVFHVSESSSFICHKGLSQNPSVWQEEVSPGSFRQSVVAEYEERKLLLIKYQYSLFLLS